LFLCLFLRSLASGTLLRDDPEYGVAQMDVDDEREGGDQAKLTVRFVTTLPNELRVVETPFEVPSDFSRLGECRATV
jgi:hypothetical protein